MKPLVFVTLLFLCFSGPPVMAQEQQVVVPYTLADRDRMIRSEAKMEGLESKMNALETKMDVKFESIQRQLDQLTTLFYWGFGILITLFIFMLGYMIWDRRTALQPALDKANESDAKGTNLIMSLREYSRKHPDLADILRSHGIL